MDWKSELEQEQSFLRKQLVLAEQKITHSQDALVACQDGLEAEGLKKMLHTAQLERDLLNGLLAHQMTEDALSLDALIIQQTEHYQRETARLSQGWQRGHSTPPAYWEAESKHAFITDLLRRYHAWRAGRPYYAQTPSRINVAGKPQQKPPDAIQAGRGYWMPTMNIHDGEGVVDHEDDIPDSPAALDALRQTIYEVLHERGYPDNHLEIIVQPEEVTIEGYAHSDDESEQILQAILEIKGVREVLADIQTVPAAHCPACHAATPAKHL